MRIVSLLPSATEIAASLGLFEQLVGVSHECDFPTEARQLPVLTGSILDHNLSPAQIDKAVSAARLESRPIYTVDGELLASLKPDLILTQGVCAVCAVTPDTVQEGLAFARLEASCTAPVLSLSGMDRAGIEADIRAVAEACGVLERAEGLIASMEARWAAIPTLERTPSVLMLEWPDPPWSAGHWVPEQVTAAGGRDPFGTPGAPSRRLTWAQIVEADPDIIVASACGFDLPTNRDHIASLIAANPEVAALRAVRTGQVWAADANAFFSRPAPRVIDGAELLSAILRGGPVDPTRACQVEV